MSLMHEHPSQGWAGDSAWWVDLNVSLNSQNTGGNYSNVTLTIVTYSANGATSQTGVFVGEIWEQGGLVANQSGNYSISTGGVQIAGWSGNIGHDANGNANPYIEYYSNMPSTEMSRRGANWGLPRIALAPSISSVIADSITPTSARLGAEISSVGHGTSAAFDMYYRLQGNSTWIPLGHQDDVSGYNYWNATGLQPGKTYEYYCTCNNNNGDTATSSVHTFATKPIAGMVPILMGLIG